MAFLLALVFLLGVVLARPFGMARLLGVVLARPLGMARFSDIADPLALALLLGVARSAGAACFSGVARLPKSFARWGRSVCWQRCWEREAVHRCVRKRKRRRGWRKLLPFPKQELVQRGGLHWPNRKLLR